MKINPKTKKLHGRRKAATRSVAKGCVRVLTDAGLALRM